MYIQPFLPSISIAAQTPCYLFRSKVDIFSLESEYMKSEASTGMNEYKVRDWNISDHRLKMNEILLSPFSDLLNIVHSK